MLRPRIHSVRRPLASAISGRSQNALAPRVSRRLVSTAETAPSSGAPLPPPPGLPSGPQKPILYRARLAAKYTGLLCASGVVGIVLVTGALLVHDAFTYSDIHVERVPVSPLALYPERGGPKNLPVAKSLVGDEEDEKHMRLRDKPHLVIVGGGWGVRHRSKIKLCSPLTILFFAGCVSSENSPNWGISYHTHLARHLHTFHTASPLGSCGHRPSTLPCRTAPQDPGSPVWPVLARKGC
jgi:hypothetical protein